MKRLSIVFLFLTLILSGCSDCVTNCCGCDKTVVPVVVVDDCSPTQDVRVTWDAPIARIDGTVFTTEEIREYELQYRLVSATEYESLFSVDTTYELSLDNGEYCFRVRVTDVNDLTSEFSDEVCKMIDCDE